MSQECYDKLVAELRNLITVELPKAQDELSEARDKGDLSENFEYHVARRAHGRLLSKIRYKQRILANARVLDTAQRSGDTVQLLCKVEITELEDQQDGYLYYCQPPRSKYPRGEGLYEITHRSGSDEP